MTFNNLCVNYTITVVLDERLNMTVVHSGPGKAKENSSKGKPDYIMIKQDMAVELFRALLNPRKDPGRVTFHVTRLT